MTTISSLSIFFPAYNEELNIEETIHQAVKAAKLVTDTYEIIIVNDASKDKTAEVVQNLKSTYGDNLILISHEANKGYGGALITGFANAKHDYIFFSDADLQFNLQELTLLTPHTATHDVVIGYRHDRQDSKMRLLNAKGWNILNRILFGLRVIDIDCAFKLFKRDTIKDIKITSQGAMISAEVLIALTQRGVDIKEVPVTHLPRTQGNATGANIKVIMRALKEVFNLFVGDLGKQVKRQFFTFALIGVFNTIVDVAAYVFLTRINPTFASHYVLVKASTYLLGTVSGFILNSMFTFKQRKVGVQEMAKFYAVTIASLLVNVSLTYVFTSIFGIYDIASVILATGLCFVFTFIFLKTWVFIAKKTR